MVQVLLEKVRQESLLPDTLNRRRQAFRKANFRDVFDTGNGNADSYIARLALALLDPLTHQPKAGLGYYAERSKMSLLKKHHHAYNAFIASDQTGALVYCLMALFTSSWLHSSVFGPLCFGPEHLQTHNSDVLTDSMRWFVPRASEFGRHVRPLPSNDAEERRVQELIHGYCQVDAMTPITVCSPVALHNLSARATNTAFVFDLTMDGALELMVQERYLITWDCSQVYILSDDAQRSALAVHLQHLGKRIFFL